MDFTAQQDQAIRLRKKDILVSAGAGAGKTRVLVERIVGLLLDKEDPVMANELLVLTFTKAAAAEMKERLLQAMETKRIESPRDYTLAKQIRMLKSADISTVHSFCSRLLRNHFQEMGLDPSFRLGQDGELQLLREKVMADLLEEEYRRADPSFMELIEAYAPEKEDYKMEKLMESLYDFSNNFPYPSKWLKQCCIDAENSVDPETFYETNMCQYIFKTIKEEISFGCHKIEEAWPYFEGYEVPRFQQMMTGDQKLFDKLSNAVSLEEIAAIVQTESLPGLVRANKAEKDWSGLEDVKRIHGEVKTILQDKILPFCDFHEKRLLEENRVQSKRIQTLCRLVQEYSQAYFQEKQSRNILDYNDLEHLSLSLLHQESEDGLVPSEVALELQEKYKAIFVDEYQDTNLVQEMLINTLHKPEKNRLFVVGDVKQSIYRFRQARPDLFLRRYHRYQEEEDGNIKIELQDNFRSSNKVIETCNLVFSHCMRGDFGGVDYTEEVALRQGEGSSVANCQEDSELLILTDNQDFSLEDAGTDRLEGETRMIALRIQELKQEGYQYGDMAILMRSVSSYAEDMAQQLKFQGIPCICESQTGYFDSREISLMLNYLAVIDNVYQDIPMASVLLSSIAGFSNEDLVRIKLEVMTEEKGKLSLYDMMMDFSASSQNSQLVRKVRSFLKNLQYFRRRKKEIPLHELIWEIYQETGYFYEIMLYEGAEEKKKNLMMLVQKAQEYEKTMYKGLFYFLRYMRQLQSYDIELTAAGKQSMEDAVKIMTIHKSKGLEFPVVFISRLHGKFNKIDMNQKLLMHPDFGMGLEYVDLEYRISRDSYQKKIIRKKLETELLEEELRVLYVAMTRAQKKLIMTAYVKEETLEEQLENYGRYFNPKEAKCLLDWILASVAAKKGEDIPFLKVEQIPVLHVLDENDSDEKVVHISLEELLEEDDFIRRKKDVEKIEKVFSYRYPYEELVGWKRKYSVSEIKKLAQKAQEQEEGSVIASFSPGLRPLQGAELEAAQRGTIIHKMMELLPFKDINTKKDLFDAIDTIRQVYPPARQLSAKMLFRYAEGFLFSEMGKYIKECDQQGMLAKELPFTMGVPAAFLYPDTSSEEKVIVQGIIDACIFEGESICLIDYKTDRVAEGEEGVLLDRYRAQMLYYKIALEQISQKKVTKTYIYSFALSKFIEIPAT